MNYTSKILIMLFITVSICLRAFSDQEVRYYRYNDDKGTITFTDNPASIPEKFKDKAQVIIMEKSESQDKKTERYFIMNQQGGKREYLDDNGHGEMWWRNYIQSWNNKLENAQKKLEENRKKYFTDPTLDVFAKKKLQEEIEKNEEELKEAEKMLREVIPEEARKAGALPGWLRINGNE